MAAAADGPAPAIVDVLLVAAIGPNPASVTEAIWALHRHRARRVVEAHLVALARGHYWLAHELLGADGALADLRAALPDVLPGGDAAVHELVTRAADGTAVTDDTTEEGAAAYRAAVWTAARACVERAGPRPVVFLLAGGRQRTMTAYAVAVYQLLARAQDELVDVRVSDRRAEGGSGFFFPEQRQRHVVTDHGALDVTTVDVTLVPVEVPRLAGLIAAEHLVSFETALERSRQAIEALAPPQLVVDLEHGVVTVNGAWIPLSPGQVAWYGLLAVQRVRAGAHGEGWVPTHAGALFAELLPGVAGTAWAQKIRDYSVRVALGLPMIHGKVFEPDKGEYLAKLRADTAKAVKTWLGGQVRPAWEPRLVPTKRKDDHGSFQRLDLDPGAIEIRWPP